MPNVSSAATATSLSERESMPRSSRRRLSSVTSARFTLAISASVLANSARTSSHCILCLNRSTALRLVYLNRSGVLLSQR
jgi:hypothetical protein